MNIRFRPIAYLTWLVLLFGVTGCTEPPVAPIRFGLATAPVTLDPRFATDATSSRVNRLIYARLVDFDDRLRPVPSLAAWEELSPTHYRFRLRADRRGFSNGRPITAHDVKATYDAVLDPAGGSPHRASLKGVISVEAVDDRTVDFRLKVPDLLFPGKLVIGILPETLIAKGHRFNTQPVGSGAFAFVDWAHEGLLRLRRLDDGQAFELVRVADPNTRVLKILNKELDLLQGDLAPEIVGWLSERDGVNVARGLGTKFAYLGFNLEDPIVGDERVRRAIAHAIDRDTIIRYVMGEAARPALSILAPSHWAGEPGLAPITFDLNASRRLLAEAGYSNVRRPRIVYKTSAAPFRVRLATIIQAQLARAGIDVEVQSHDWGTFYGDVKAGRFQMYSLAWVGIKMPDIFRYVFHSDSVPPDGANRGRLRDPEVDRLIEAAERAESFELQARWYRALQRRVHAALPYVPLWYEDNVGVSRPGVHGYRLNTDGNYDGLRDVVRSG